MPPIPPAEGCEQMYTGKMAGRQAGRLMRAVEGQQGHNNQSRVDMLQLLVLGSTAFHKMHRVVKVCMQQP